MIQGSPEWHEARRGKITASRFGVIMNGGVDGWNSYIEEIRYGWKDEITTASMQWGIDHEASARGAYELLSGYDVVEVGFVVHPILDNVGGSPDGFVDHDGMIEIKCPFNPEIHDSTLKLGVPLEHIPQIQGNLWISGRNWCDFVSFDPREEHLSRRCFIQRVKRCENYHRKIERRIAKFREILSAGRYAVISDFQINPFEDEVPELF